MVMKNTVQETIIRIQEEAKLKVELARFSKSKTNLVVKKNITKLVVPAVEQAPTAQQVADTLREHLSTAIAQALSTKAARNYIGDITESLQNIATEVVANNRSDFGGTLKDSTTNKVIIYPNNCKLLVQGEQSRGCMVIEEPPQYRTILYSNGRINPSTYRIPMPYVVYVIGFVKKNHEYYIHGCGLGFGKKPIDSIDDKLLQPHIPHASGNNHICQPMAPFGHESLKKLGEYVVQTFWNTSFIYSFRSSGCDFSVENKKISSFEDWQNINNPLDVLKADFHPGDTVKSLLVEMGKVVESRNSDSLDRKIQSVVNNVVNNVSETFSADELANVIRTTAEEIVNVALQNSIGNFGLQQPKTVV